MGAAAVPCDSPRGYGSPREPGPAAAQRRWLPPWPPRLLPCAPPSPKPWRAATWSQFDREAASGYGAASRTHLVCAAASPRGHRVHAVALRWPFGAQRFEPRCSLCALRTRHWQLAPRGALGLLKHAPRSRVPILRAGSPSLTPAARQRPAAALAPAPLRARHQDSGCRAPDTDMIGCGAGHMPASDAILLGTICTPPHAFSVT